MASFSGDLTSMTAPPFILSSTSLVEYSAYWGENPELFVAPTFEADPELRALSVLKWFLATLRRQYTSRNEKLGSEKKPLNPFLGELFLGVWKSEDPKVGDTRLISEQVSHHPPVTAYALINEKNGVRLEGYNGQKAGFSRMTISVTQIGHALLHLDQWDEDYLITLPSLHIEGLVTGSPFVELNKKSYIYSSTGYTATVDYSGRGWLSGKKNSFTATLQKDTASKPAYTISGQWSGDFVVKDANKKDIESYTSNSHPTTPLTLAPIEAQSPLESRKAWSKVAEALAAGDYEATSAEKSKIENEQRELRKKEKEEGKEWQRRYFSAVETDPRFEAIASKVGFSAETEKTGGYFWVFDGEKTKRADAEAAAPAQAPAAAAEQVVAEGKVAEVAPTVV